jgi:alpha-ketoglutarate-dependent sulfate ester dioxygenase
LVTTTADVSTAVTVRPVAGYTGADISGVDISEPLTAEQIAAIKDALHEYKVIFFRDQFRSGRTAGSPN